MNFKDEINYLENIEFDGDYIIKLGNIPILFCAPHTMEQNIEGIIKHGEVYTKAIALYLNKHYGVSCMIKVKDTGLDSNRDNHDEFKEQLIKLVKDNNIGIVIDLHGASKVRDFDVEFGTLNNLTADVSTIKELEESFKEHNIFNIKHNVPFKGGAITQYLYNLKNVDVIQLEINKRYRDINNIDKLESICNSLGYFIKQYIKCIIYNKCKFRLANLEDCKELALLKRRVWETTYRGIYPDEILDNFDYEYHKKKFEKIIKNEDIKLYVVVIDKKIVGYFDYGRPFRDNKNYEQEIGLLYLLKEYQGLGIGKKMFLFAKDKIKESGYNEFYISCNKYNYNSQNFYKKMGGIIKRVDDDNIDKTVPQIYYYFKIR